MVNEGNQDFSFEDSMEIEADNDTFDMNGKFVLSNTKKNSQQNEKPSKLNFNNIENDNNMEEDGEYNTPKLKPRKNMDQMPEYTGFKGESNFFENNFEHHGHA